jgi:hypothetical protein
MSDPNDFPEFTDAQNRRWRAAASEMSEMLAHLREGVAKDKEIHGQRTRPQ